MFKVIYSPLYINPYTPVTFYEIFALWLGSKDEGEWELINFFYLFQNVQGHIFEIDDEKLAALDELEAHPDLYIRFKTDIAMTHDEDGNSIDPPEIRECWVYFLPRFKPEMLDLPYYRNYTSISDDHPPYVERYRRKGPLLRELVLPE